MSVANPAEIAAGPQAPADAFHRLLEPLLDQQHFDDLVVHLNVQAYYSFGGDGSDRLLATIDLLGASRWPGGTRTTVVLRNMECAPPEERVAIGEACSKRGIPWYHSFDEAAVAVAAGQRFDRARSRHRADGCDKGSDEGSDKG